MGTNRECTATRLATGCSLPLISGGKWTELARELELTPRQADIVQLLLAAKKDKQIATELGLSITTVRMHLRHIFARLHVADRMELALRVFQLLCEHCQRKPTTSEMMYQQ